MSKKYYHRFDIEIFNEQTYLLGANETAENILELKRYW